MTGIRFDAVTEEAAVLLELVPNSSNLRGAEVGVLRGKTSAILLYRLPGLHLTMVDNWNTAGIVEDPPEQVRKAANENTEFAAHRRTILELPSIEAAEKIEDGSQDFVYIDALHHYEDVKADITAWWPKVASGGLLAGHDYGRAHADSLPAATMSLSEGAVLYGWNVARAVHEFLLEHDLPLEHLQRTTWAVRKP